MCKDMRDSKKASDDLKKMSNSESNNSAKSSEKSTEHQPSSHKGCGCGGY